MGSEPTKGVCHLSDTLVCPECDHSSPAGSFICWYCSRKFDNTTARSDDAAEPSVAPTRDHSIAASEWDSNTPTRPGNAVGSALSVIGWAVIALTILTVLVLFGAGGLGVAFPALVTGCVGGIIILGFAEIINLLHKIHVNLSSNSKH